jgi:macrolide transport system ATP-binding/permease protein
MSPLIRIRSLSKVYRMGDDPSNAIEVFALKGVDLEIHRGDFVAIMGPSGSGKSTLMQILGLLDRHSDGKYELEGQDVSNLSDDDLALLRTNKMSFIFQFFNLLPRTSCLNNVCLPMLYKGVPNPERKAKLLLEQVGLGSRLGHQPHQLSGGQQQRVAIARALANEPEIIFADEPTGNIATEQAEEILNLLEELNQKGVTIVLVTHEPEVAARARRLITIRDGKVASDLTTRERSAPMPHRPERPALTSEEMHQASQWNIRRLKESMRMAFVALSLNKMRTALATLGVIIGIASVMGMVSAGQGAKRAISQQLSSLGTNLVSIYATQRPGPSGKYKRFGFDDLDALKRINERRPIFKDFDAQAFGSVLVANGANNRSTQLIGTLPAFERMGANTPIAGRFFDEKDNQSKSRVAVLGQTVVRELYGADVNPVGSTIKINRVDFRVIGVLPAKGGNSFQDRDDRVIIPLQTALFRVLGRSRFQNMVAEITDQSMIAGGIELLTEALRKQRKLASFQENDFEIFNQNEIQDVYNKTVGIVSSMLATIACVSLLVGGIGIMNVMLVAVKERTKEVGLRKALGARRKDILSQFLVESTIIGLVGGAIGLVLGFFVSWIASRAFDWPLVITLGAVSVAFFFAFAVGLVFGIWPARQAAALSPIEALRYE